MLGGLLQQVLAAADIEASACVGILQRYLPCDGHCSVATCDKNSRWPHLLADSSDLRPVFQSGEYAVVGC
jgi:hypothetical protein